MLSVDKRSEIKSVSSHQQTDRSTDMLSLEHFGITSRSPNILHEFLNLKGNWEWEITTMLFPILVTRGHHTFFFPVYQIILVVNQKQNQWLCHDQHSSWRSHVSLLVLEGWTVNNTWEKKIYAEVSHISTVDWTLHLLAVTHRPPLFWSEYLSEFSSTLSKCWLSARFFLQLSAPWNSQLRPTNLVLIRNLLLPFLRKRETVNEDISSHYLNKWPFLGFSKY